MIIMRQEKGHLIKRGHIDAGGEKRKSENDP